MWKKQDVRECKNLPVLSKNMDSYGGKLRRSVNSRNLKFMMYQGKEEERLITFLTNLMWKKDKTKGLLSYKLKNPEQL